MGQPAVASDRVVQDFPQSIQDDAHVAAMDRQTAAMNALVDQIREARADFKPAADALHSLGEAQTKFCEFIVKNRLKLAAGILSALVAVGAISPAAAGALGSFLKGLGMQ